MHNNETLDELITPDSRNVLLGITADSLRKELDEVPISPRVPEEVRKVLDVSKKLCLYGYFQYYFFDVAMFYSYLAAELALKFKLVQNLPSNGCMIKDGQTTSVPPKVSSVDRTLRNRWRFENEPKLTGSLGSILRWVERKGFIADRWRDRTETLRQLRNMMAHPDSHQFVGPAMAVGCLHSTFDFINCLFDKEAWDKEPPVLRSMRKRGEQIAREFQEYQAKRHQSKHQK